MNYPERFIKLSKAYYTDMRGIIYAILRATGITPAAAYFHAFRGQTSETICNQAAQKLENDKYINQLITALKTAKKTPIIIQSELTKEDQKKDIKEGGKEGGNVLQTFSGVRNELIKVVDDITGKDKANVLVQLAKMVPEETTPEDQRVILYIPFNSDCRRCALYNNKV